MIARYNKITSNHSFFKFNVNLLYNQKDIFRTLLFNFLNINNPIKKTKICKAETQDYYNINNNNKMYSIILLLN